MNIFAYTALGLMPAYISINETEGGAMVTVRERPSNGPYGHTAEIYLTDAQLNELAEKILQHNVCVHLEK